MATRYIKVFQSAILLHVNMANKTNSKGLSKVVDECAYTKMIEDFSKQAFRSHDTIFLMQLMPRLFHEGFVQQKTKEAMLASLESLLNEHAVRERDQVNEVDVPEAPPAQIMIDTTDNKDK